MNTEFFICTYAKDFPWLKYCLRSMKKFTQGFAALNILVPVQDLLALEALTDTEMVHSVLPVRCFGGGEWPGLGMLWHECQVMFADQHCPNADFIAHLDPDCIFTGPATPETFFKNGKPILPFENFNFIGVRHPAVLRWREATEKCLPFPVLYETMRRHPEVYHRGLYMSARAQMVLKTGLPVPDYIMSCKNEFPQGFCEYVTLGNVAMHLFREFYHPIEQISDRIIPEVPVMSFWSHGPIDQTQNIWINGIVTPTIPVQKLKQFGLFI